MIMSGAGRNWIKRSSDIFIPQIAFVRQKRNLISFEMVEWDEWNVQRLIERMKGIFKKGENDSAAEKIVQTFNPASHGNPPWNIISLLNEIKKRLTW